MTCLKKVIPEILMLIGMAIIIGAVGHDEYMTEIGQYYPVSHTLMKIVVGFLLTIPESVRIRHDG